MFVLVMFLFPTLWLRLAASATLHSDCFNSSNTLNSTNLLPCPFRMNEKCSNLLPVHRHRLAYVKRTIRMASHVSLWWRFLYYYSKVSSEFRYLRTTNSLHYNCNTIGACYEILFIGRSTTSGSLSDLDCLTDGSDGALPRDVCLCCPKRPSFGFVVNTSMTFKNPLRLNIMETTKLAVVGMVLVPCRNDIHRTTLSGTMQT